MQYAVIINLDYENHSQSSLDLIWDAIVEQMSQVGFRLDARVFTIAACENEAAQLAHEAIENVESHKEFHQKKIYSYIKDFFGFECGSFTNLVLPPVHQIHVGGRLSAPNTILNRKNPGDAPQ